MENFERDERNILYEGAERRRYICAETELLEQLSTILKHDRHESAKFMNPAIVIPIIFSIVSALFLFIWNINDKSNKLEYKVDTLEKDRQEIKDDIKQIHKNIDSIDGSLQHMLDNNRSNKSTGS